MTFTGKYRRKEKHQASIALVCTFCWLLSVLRLERDTDRQTDKGRNRDRNRKRETQRQRQTEGGKEREKV